jgi:hypothetical protein
MFEKTNNAVKVLPNNKDAQVCHSSFQPTYFKTNHRTNHIGDLIKVKVLISETVQSTNVYHVMSSLVSLHFPEFTLSKIRMAKRSQD